MLSRYLLAHICGTEGVITSKLYMVNERLYTNDDLQTPSADEDVI